MQGTLLALLFLLTPLLLVLFLRTNAAILFFVLCGASTLQTYLDKDVASFAGSLFGGTNTRAVSLLLLIVPFIVAAISFRRTVTKRMIFFHLLLSLGVGLSLVFIVPQFLPPTALAAIQESDAFVLLAPYTSIVIAASFLASVVLLWTSHPKHDHHKKHGH